MINKKDEIHLNIYPTKYKCKIIFYKKSLNRIEILSEIEKRIPMNSRVFIEKSAREEYINEISNCIVNESLKYKKSNSIFVNIQESDIIIKNIKIDSEIKKRDLIKAVNIEIKEFCTNSFNDYCIDYKNIYTTKDDTEVQVVLFPKKYINLFSEICEKIGIENKSMHTNFSLVERLLNKRKVKVMDKLYSDLYKDEKLAVVEFREKDFVISIFQNQSIKNSYVIKKDEFTDEIGESIFSDCLGILNLGDKTAEDIKLIKRFSDIMEVDFEEDVEFTKNNKKVSAKEYFQIAGKNLN